MGEREGDEPETIRERERGRLGRGERGVGQRGLATWLSASDMPAAEHKSYKPTIADMRAYVRSEEA